jgi:hypothetical protein
LRAADESQTVGEKILAGNIKNLDFKLQVLESHLDAHLDEKKKTTMKNTLLNKAKVLNNHLAAGDKA